MEAAFVPEVKDELDTQNFEKFEEVARCSTILVNCQSTLLGHFLIYFFFLFSISSLTRKAVLHLKLVHGER